MQMRRVRGFTLVEMMIVLSMIGTVTAAIAAFVHRSYSHTRLLEMRLGADRDARVAMAFVRDDLRANRVTKAAQILELAADNHESIVYRVEDEVLFRDVTSKGTRRSRISLMVDVRSVGFIHSGSLVKTHVSVERQVGDLLLRRDYERTFSAGGGP